MINRSGEIDAKYKTENSSQEEDQESRGRRQEKAHCRSPAHGDSHCAGSGGRQVRRSQTEMKSAGVKR
jgi:hypothetical protein